MMSVSVSVWRTAPPVQFIGVVSDTSSVRPGERDDGMLYQSIGAANLATASVLMRFTGNPQRLMQLIRSEVRALDPQLFVCPETVARRWLDSERYAAVVKLTAIPAGFVAFLSMVGIYGVTSFAVAQRCQSRCSRGARGPARTIVGMFFLSLRWPLLVGVTLGFLFSALGTGCFSRRT